MTLNELADWHVRTAHDWRHTADSSPADRPEITRGPLHKKAEFHDEAVRALARVTWQPIETAPKDGTILLLQVEDAEHPFEDESVTITIGSFGVEGGPDADPTWHFAGWSWHHDCYCRGSGTPTYWMLPPERVQSKEI